MTGRRRPMRDIVCEVCGKDARTQLKTRDICRGCHRAEPSTCCIRCGLLKHDVSEESALCSRCVEMTARPESICAKCSQLRVIYNEEAWLCRPCHAAALRRERDAGQPANLPCSVCDKMRPSVLRGRAICPSCWRAERNGRALCAKCGKLKAIAVKSEGVCKQCYKDLFAPQALRAYVEGYTTPFPFNRVLFGLMAATIDWQSVGQKLDRRFRAFGRFLQEHEFREPLTWEAIQAALPDLGPTNRNVPKQIRASLLDLGQLLAAQGKLESKETYTARRNALLPVQGAPEVVRPLLERYAAWLWERQTRPGNVRDHMEALVAFWSWCDRRGIRSPAEVQSGQIGDYMLTLYWEWQCSECGGTSEFDRRQPEAGPVCEQCGALHSLAQVKRYAQNTIRGNRAKLRVFFDWCKIGRTVVTHPVHVRIAAPAPTIRHYPPDVVRKLCAYVVAPDADPVEAMVLYLIIFHALSVWELRHIRIPIILCLNQDAAVPALSEAYYLLLPHLSPSLGDRSPGRPDVRLDFPPGTADWLCHLLDRCERQRREIVRNPANDFLFVSSASARRNMPVGNIFFWEIVQRASLRVLGAACNLNTLRKTVGVMFADKAGAGILLWMGWDDQQAFAYTWAGRETVHPRSPDGDNDTLPEPGPDPVSFPSPRGAL